MRIDLDRHLAEAARDDHDPSRVTAASLQRTLHGARARQWRWWAELAVALAVLVGFFTWYQPRLGPAPSPAPSWSWDGLIAPDQDSLPTALVEQRCPRREGETVVDNRTAPVPGGQVTFAPKDWDGKDPSKLRSCALGHQLPASQDGATAAELDTDLPGLLALCQRQTGFDFSGHEWHAVTASPVRSWKDTGPARVVGIVGDAGWQVSCLLQHDHPSWLTFRKVRQAAATSCPDLVLASPDADEAYPATTTSRANASDPEHYTGRQLRIASFSVVPDADHRPDTTVASIDITAKGNVNRPLGSFAVHSGFVAVAEQVTLPKPVQLSWTSTRVAPLEVTLRDAAGRTLRRCTLT